MQVLPGHALTNPREHIKQEAAAMNYAATYAHLSIVQQTHAYV